MSRIIACLSATALLCTSYFATSRLQSRHVLHEENIRDTTQYLGPEDAPNHPSLHNLLPYEVAREHCARHRLEAYQTRNRPRKIYDLFLINTETDWAEIRLNELTSSVDHFIIMESALTFQETSKPLYFKDQYQIPTFQPFHQKIIYRTVNFTNIDFPKGDTWAREHFTRDALFTQGLATLSPKQAPQQGDVILVSDIDEIPRPTILKTLRNCAFPARTTLRSQMYLYSFQWLRRGDWLHPQATFFNGLDKTSAARCRDWSCW